MQQLADRVSALENEIWPRVVRLEAMFAQQYMSPAASMITPWNNQPYGAPYPTQHASSYVQQYSGSTPQHSTHVGNQSQHSTPQDGSCNNRRASRLQNAPQCRQIERREMTSYLPSSRIDNSKLATPEAILTKYHKLRVESKAGILAVKLAKEAFFGVDVLAQCTVRGCRDLPALPLPELNELKQVLFNQFPNYWHTPEEFESIWERAGESIGQCAKGLRKKRAAN